MGISGGKENSHQTLRQICRGAEILLQVAGRSHSLYLQSKNKQIVEIMQIVVRDVRITADFVIPNPRICTEQKGELKVCVIFYHF